MAFNPNFSWEFLTADEIEAKSVRALRNHVRHTIEVSGWYREKLAGFNAQDIQSLDDFRTLPTTTKDALVDNLPAFTAAQPEEIVETVITSGSTGKPLVFSLTHNDIERLAFNEALAFHSMGVGPGDKAQIVVSLDRMFIAGMAYYRGLTTLGVNTMRLGVLPIDMQLHYLDLLKPTVLVGVPSFLRKLGAELKAQGFDLQTAGVRTIACIGESIRGEDMKLNAMGSELEALFGAKVYSTYGNTELSIAYCECTEQKGGHSRPELVYTEILDEKGNPVPDGQPGELVATPLGVEGVPLIRYRTGDITFRLTESCPCGRNSCRIGPILARKSQMIKLKGTTVYPLTITNALDQLDYIQDYLIILEGDDALSDQVQIHVVAPAAKVELIAGHLRAQARVSFPVLVSNMATIQGLRGKSSKKIRVLDKRHRRG